LIVYIFSGKTIIWALAVAVGFFLDDIDSIEGPRLKNKIFPEDPSAPSSFLEKQGLIADK